MTCAKLLARTSHLTCLQDTTAAATAPNAVIAGSGFSLMTLHRPMNACSFSVSSRIPRSALHQAAQKCARCGATCSGHIHATRPSVMALFSMMLRVRRPPWIRMPAVRSAMLSAEARQHDRYGWVHADVESGRQCNSLSA